MVRNKYFTTGLGIYISYFMLGMALILLSSNMEFVTKQLNTDVAGITFLISIEGIVRSASVYIREDYQINLEENRFYVYLQYLK